MSTSLFYFFATLVVCSFFLDATCRYLFIFRMFANHDTYLPQAELSSTMSAVPPVVNVAVPPRSHTTINFNYCPFDCLHGRTRELRQPRGGGVSAGPPASHPATQPAT